MDVSAQHQTSKSEAENKKQMVSGNFSYGAQNFQMFPTMGILWSCVDMANYHWELEDMESNLKKNILGCAVLFIKKNLFCMGKMYLRCSALNKNK